MNLTIDKKVKITSLDYVNLLSVIMLIIFYIFPYFASISNLRRVFIVVVSVGLFFITVFMKNKRSFGNILLCFFLVFFLQNLIYYAQWKTRVNYFQGMYFQMLFWIPFIMQDYIIRFYNRKMLATIFYTVLLSTLIICISTIIGLDKYPMAARLLATGQNELYNLDSLYRQNIGGYGFINSLVLMIPYLIYFYKNNSSRFKVIYICIIFVFIYCIILSQYTIASTLAILSFSISFSKSKKLVAILLIVLVVLFYFVAGIDDIEVAINKLSELAEEHDLGMVSYRLRDFAKSLNSNEGLDEINRIHRYKLSLNEFIKSPIFGTMAKNDDMFLIGGHSSVLDTLASIGIIFFCLLLYIAHIYLKRMRLLLVNTQLYQYFIIVFTNFVLVSFINTVFSSRQIAIVLFIFSVAVSYKECRGEGESIESFMVS